MRTTERDRARGGAECGVERLTTLRASLPASCPACAGRSSSQLCGPERMRDLGQRAREFHAARLRSQRREELDERASFTQDDATSLFACRACGLVLRWPQPEPDDLLRSYVADRYPEDRLAEMTASGVALHRRQLPGLRRLIARDAPRVVEVGSFVGGFLEVARTAGWRARGVDPNPQLAESCRARGLDVTEGTLQDVAEADPPVTTDAVAIWNTFDQLADPEPVLEASSRLLRECGILALRVPHGLAFRTLHEAQARTGPVGRRFFEACLAWNNLLSFPYLRGYGLASLDAIVPRHGFRRVRVRGDVMGIVSGRATRGFARREERAVKQLQTAWIALQARERESPLPAAPWLEVYYRRVASGTG